MLKGSFDTDAANAFTLALNDILKVGIEKVVIKINPDGNVKAVAKAPSDTNFVVIDFKKDTLFKDFTLPAEPFEFGIINLAEFNSVARVFKDGFDLKVNNELTVMQHDTNKYLYYPFKVRKEDQGPSRFVMTKEPTVTFKWDDNMSSFSKAINSLSQEHVVFTGEKDAETLEIAITNSQHKNYNTFKVTAKCTPIKESFRTILEKTKIQPVLTGSQATFDVKLYPQLMVLFTAECDYFTINQAINFKRR